MSAAKKRNSKPPSQSHGDGSAMLHEDPVPYTVETPEKQRAATVLPVTTEIMQGDCREVLRDFERGTFDLIVTSPPYADQRNKTYGGIKPEKYVEWFLARSEEFLRVLKPSGSFVLNIKEKAEAGERHVYVLELILALRKQGWLWTEEYIWHKRNCHPGKWPNRFRELWEGFFINHAQPSLMHVQAVA